MPDDVPIIPPPLLLPPLPPRPLPLAEEVAGKVISGLMFYFVKITIRNRSNLSIF